MAIETIGAASPYSHDVRMIFAGDDRAELLAHAEDWARKLGWGYGPRYSQPVEVDGHWEIIASRYRSCD